MPSRLRVAASYGHIHVCIVSVPSAVREVLSRAGHRAYGPERPRQDNIALDEFEDHGGAVSFERHQPLPKIQSPWDSRLPNQNMIAHSASNFHLQRDWTRRSNVLAGTESSSRKTTDYHSKAQWISMSRNARLLGCNENEYVCVSPFISEVETNS